jgi:hypothetical protein
MPASPASAGKCPVCGIVRSVDAKIAIEGHPAGAVIRKGGKNQVHFGGESSKKKGERYPISFYRKPKTRNRNPYYSLSRAAPTPEKILPHLYWG